MSSVLRQRQAHSLDFNAAVSRGYAQAAAAAAQDKLRLLKQLTMELQQGLETLTDTPLTDFQQGLDFYQEVSRFEIELIRWALTLMEGHQGKAARLLNLNATTLNAKIKHYGIQMNPFPSQAAGDQKNGET